MKKSLSILLALLMLLSLAACGGGSSSGSSSGGGENVYKLGDFELEYKGAKIAPDDDGIASVILWLGFTNNSKAPYTYGFSMSEKAEQAGEFMFPAALASVSEEYRYKETQPGETTDIIVGYNLNAVDYEGNLNYTDEVKFTITEGDSGKTASITVNPADIPNADSILDVMSGDAATSGVSRTDTEVGGGYEGSITWLDYWVGDWYGWWLLTDGTGAYADLGDGEGRAIWDACAIIEAHEDTTGYMEVWDSDDTVIAMLNLSFANPDDTEYGVMCCRGGQFLGQEVEDDAWYVNPEELAYENVFDFRGEVEDEYGTYSYRVLLRPWGVEWDDLDEAYYPDSYYDWYLPLIEAGKDMPDTIG